MSGVILDFFITRIRTWTLLLFIFCCMFNSIFHIDSYDFLIGISELEKIQKLNLEGRKSILNNSKLMT